MLPRRAYPAREHFLFVILSRKIQIVFLLHNHQFILAGAQTDLLGVLGADPPVGDGGGIGEVIAAAAEAGGLQVVVQLAAGDVQISGNGNNVDSNAPQTGDNTNILPYAVMAAAALAAAGYAIARRKKVR